MAFSERFKEKYIVTNDKKMQAVMSRSMRALKQIKATQEDRELVLEYLYAFKECFAEPRGIDMDKIYARLDNIKIIEHKKIELDNTIGYCSAEKDGIHIVIDDEKCDSYYERRHVLGHELIHALSIDVIDKRFDYRYKMLMTGGAEESATDGIAFQMDKFLGFQPETRDFRFQSEEYKHILGPTISTYLTGYAAIVGYSDVLENTFGPAFYDNKFLLGNTRERLDYYDCYNRVNKLLETITQNPCVEPAIELEHILLDRINHRHQLIDEASIDRYIKDVKAFNDTEIQFFFEQSTADILFTKAHSAVEYQTAFEIEHIYSQFIKKIPEDSVYLELNPLTRSRECYDFLVGMAALKQLDKSYSSEDILDMKCEKTSKGYSLIIGDDKYFIHADIAKTTGTVFIGRILEDKAGFIDRVFGKIEGLGNSVPYANYLFAVEMDKVSDIYTKTIQNMSVNDIPLTSERDVVALAASKAGDTYMMEDMASKINISSVRDAYGNNILHVLASNESAWAAEMTYELIKQYPMEMYELSFQININGMTPADIATKNTNISVLQTLQETGLNYRSSNCFEGKVFDETKGSYVTKTDKLSETCNQAFIDCAVATGNSKLVIDSKSNTLLHMYAKGKIELKNISKVLNDGVDINSKNNDGKTPLCIAVDSCHIPAIKDFLKFDVDIKDAVVTTVNNIETATVYRYLSRKHDINTLLEVFDMLSEKGFNPNIVDNGQSLLQIASDTQQFCKNEIEPVISYDLVQRLLNAGADPFFNASEDNMSFYDLAAKTGNVKLFEMMVDAGIDKDKLCIEHTNLSAIEKESINRRIDIRDSVYEASSTKSETLEKDVMVSHDDGFGLDD